ncbi:hypothetical protein SAMN05216226_101230 [Halovenus aranensis]|uniref:DUF7573 domain-containing protein n=1 Tax=Halovenus aranensis TaxID=890420 RepID=A0A1G8S1D8_9EURY|nr:hypothetical protein [Halovenus aranensis]SDJ22971.1 hypothetical protein SAMN05216226_101230 [Halovenus aranensis]
MEDASLDEFGDSDGGEGDDKEGTEQTAAPTEESPTSTESATPTSSVDPAGTDCKECGSSTERQWFDGGTLVCRDCKDW